MIGIKTAANTKLSVGGMSISKERGESDGQGQELSLHQAAAVHHSLLPDQPVGVSGAGRHQGAGGAAGGEGGCAGVC